MVKSLLPCPPPLVSLPTPLHKIQAIITVICCLYILDLFIHKVKYKKFVLHFNIKCSILYIVCILPFFFFFCLPLAYFYVFFFPSMVTAPHSFLQLNRFPLCEHALTVSNWKDLGVFLFLILYIMLQWITQYVSHFTWMRVFLQDTLQTCTYE